MRRIRNVLVSFSLVSLVVFAVTAFPAPNSSFVVFGPHTYQSRTSHEGFSTVSFNVANPGRYTLHVINGDKSGRSSRVTSAVVTLNGREILDPSDFNANVEFVHRAVYLHSSNRLSVEIKGGPGRSFTLMIDGSDDERPVIQATATPNSNTFGWNNSNVTVTFQCKDEISGIASCSNPVTISSDGANQIATGTAVDNAGNTVSTTIKVNLDKVLPGILAAIMPAPNSNGWNNTVPVVSFNCSDALSGIASCSGPVSVSSDGANQNATGTAVDKAGNSASTTVNVNLDKALPGILASIMPAPNSNGWNNTVPVVSFNCSDALSGIASCSNPVTISSDGANQIATGTAVDKAGNSASTTVNVNLDKALPGILVSITPAPNSNGWNNTGPVVSFNCSDALSGIASCSGPVTVSGEGANQVVTGSAVDKAGNSASVTVKVNFDKSLPGISTSIAPAPNSNGWNNTDPLVSFNCSDALSGIASCSGPVTVSSEGANQVLTGTAVDMASNSASATVTVNLDKTLPGILASITPAPNSNGWNSTVPIVSFNCSDALSGITSCTSPVTVSNVGANQVVTGTAVDNAGNSASAKATVNLDTALPGILASITPAPNSNGWNNTDPVVSFNCSDALSGITSCTSPVTVSSEGVDQAVTGVAVDKADNTASSTVKVNLDKTPPGILASVTPARNSYGWINTNPVVSFNCSDALSGAASCSSPVTVTAEGALQAINGSSTDKAGNSNTASALVSLDKTPPTLSVVAPPSTVSSAALTVTGNVSDVLSGISGVTCNGIAATVSNASFSCGLNLNEGLNTIQISATDYAGNLTTSQVSVTLTSYVPPPFGPIAVSWINAVGAAGAGNNLSKTDGQLAWNSGADSAQVLRNGYGFVEFTAVETNTMRMGGLGVVDSSQSYADVDYGILLRYDSSMAILESGVFRGEFGSYATGDRFRVEVRYGVVRYLRNGVLLFTSPVPVQYPLRVDTAMYTPGATLKDVRVGNFVWTDATAVRVSGESLLKTGTPGWNAGAISTNTIELGDGYLEFTASETTTNRIGGLANPATGVAPSNIQFGILLKSDATGEIVEGGVSQAAFGGYSSGDRFRIELTNGAVRYYRNSQMLYASLQMPSYPLRANASFDTPGATLTNVSLEPIVWANNLDVYTDGALIIHKKKVDGWTSPASSTTNILAGDGYVEFTATETNSRRSLGLKSAGAAQSLQQIDYAITLNETGIIEVMEFGVTRGQFGTYNNGDRFRIEVRNGVVRYLNNDVLLYSSAVSPSYPLHAEAVFYSQGATLFDVAMGDLVWMNGVRTRANGRTLSKTTSNAVWDAGAVSTRTTTAGYMEFTASEASTYRIAGLSNGDTNQDISDIDFAIILNADSSVGIYEAGVNKGQYGTYVTGDRFRVEVQANVVRYWKNGTLLYTSLNHPSAPLRIDTSLYTAFGTLFNVVLH